MPTKTSTTASPIRIARRNAGLTVERVAVAINKSYDTVRGYERGLFTPPPPTLRALADLFGVTVSDLT